jgi:hypothetical protein
MNVTVLLNALNKQMNFKVCLCMFVVVNAISTQREGAGDLPHYRPNVPGCNRTYRQ